MENGLVLPEKQNLNCGKSRKFASPPLISTVEAVEKPQTWQKYPMKPFAGQKRLIWGQISKLDFLNPYPHGVFLHPR
jgi:hypothetical protein